MPQQVTEKIENRYFVLNKPYNMVSQFVSTHSVRLLGDLEFDFPEGIHAIGRLDNLSEGLLILTTNKRVTKLLFESKKPHVRTYLVMVNKKVSEEALQKLREGVGIKIKGDQWYTCHPCEVERVDPPVFGLINPYKMTDRIEYTWLQICLTEGKFHQVRKMITAIGHRCKRLVRVSIEDLKLDDLLPGCIKEIEEEAFFRLLKIDNYH